MNYYLLLLLPLLQECTSCRADNGRGYDRTYHVRLDAVIVFGDVLSIDGCFFNRPSSTAVRMQRAKGRSVVVVVRWAGHLFFFFLSPWADLNATRHALYDYFRKHNGF